MPQLPTGAVTFMFTDIAGSTQLLDELGAKAYAEQLAEHRKVLRSAFAQHGGVEIDTQGDAFFAVFEEADGAVRAAAEAIEALAGGRVRVRIGLHTGRGEPAEHGYVGRDVHLGARIAAAGHGGQVLLSKETRELVKASVSDLGEHRVKDFAEPVWIYQLGNERFPPLRTISNSNLPRPASSFVGRQADLAAIRRLLREGARMVSLTGPGGTGKTRLALEAAGELLADFGNGVFWVDLAPVRDPELVPASVATAIGSEGNEPAVHIADREMLLLLDNFEQVAEAAPWLAELVAGCPRLRLLVTSREVLRVRGEVEYRVSPLPESDAVTLFAERSGLPADRTVSDLCIRLDNLPLAVELAAARTSVLSPTQILERIGKRLDLLKGGRDAEARQQTLRMTIEWSYELLDTLERDLFAVVSVFSSGFTLEAAESVCSAELDTLQALVDKSLIRFADERFSMLETIGEYAREQLGPARENELRSRHAAYFLSLAEEGEPHVLSAQPAAWLNRLEREHANLRAALEWLTQIGETQSGLRLGGALWEFWCLRAHYREGVRHLSTLLAMDTKPTLARAKALTGATHLASDHVSEQVQAWSTEALELYRRLGDDWGAAFAEYQQAMLYTNSEDYATAAPLLEASIHKLRAAGDEHRALLATRTLAWCHEEMGDFKRQAELTQELLERAHATDDRMMEARALGVLANIASDAGRHAEALQRFERLFALDEEIGDPDEINLDLLRLARILALSGQAREAVILISVRQATRPDPESRDTGWVLRMEEQALEAARARLDEQAYADAWTVGQRMSVEDAVRHGRAAGSDIRAAR